MAITPRQAAARRANGRLTAGPISAQGRAASSQNSLKFGFFALHPLLPGESEAEFEAYLAGWIESLRPADHAEHALVLRITDAAWRLRRVPSVEAGLFTAELLSEQAEIAQGQARQLLMHRLEASPSEAKDPDLYRELQARELEIREELNSPQYALGRAFRRDAQSSDGFTRLSRSEMLLDRGFYRSLHELLRLQAIRRGTNKASHGATQYERQNDPTDCVENKKNASESSSHSQDQP
jgi:hypothetical protein